MRSVGFDYANTCPKIDRAISDAKHAIRTYLDDLLSDACPLLPRDVRTNLADDHAERLYSDLEDAFEATRETNEDMRKEADRQIRDLQDAITDLEHEVRNMA